jgi:hypothetical protein
MPELIEKSPWPAQGITNGTSPEDYNWGYLYLYSNGRVEFREEERPPASSINRVG